MTAIILWTCLKKMPAQMTSLVPIVISKDVDFYNRYLQKLEPYKLIYITTGNIPNEKLLNLFRKNLDKIIDGIQHNHVIEITTTSIITII